MSKRRNGIIALALGTAILIGGALGAGAQTEEGANDNDAPVAAGTLDDGANLLPLAQITIEEAIAAAQAVASGVVGEIDLEYVDGVLAFNVDIGAQDVKVDATAGAILSLDADD